MTMLFVALGFAMSLVIAAGLSFLALEGVFRAMGAGALHRQTAPRD